MVNATQTNSVCFHKCDDMAKGEWVINAGSKIKSMQTWKDHPERPGVSIAKVTPSKCVIVLGNLIRVYVFDVI